jgi:hypothetical protein
LVAAGREVGAAIIAVKKMSLAILNMFTHLLFFIILPFAYLILFILQKKRPQAQQISEGAKYLYQANTVPTNASSQLRKKLVIEIQRVLFIV